MTVRHREDALAPGRAEPCSADAPLSLQRKAYAHGRDLQDQLASAARHIAPAKHLGLGFSAVAASSRTLLTTLQLVWRERADIIHARNPFPVGGVVEDSATGAAAAALGGYLRDAGLIDTPARFTVRQGEDMGHPSLLRVDAPTDGGVRVTGTAIGIRRNAAGSTLPAAPSSRLSVSVVAVV